MKRKSTLGLAPFLEGMGPELSGVLVEAYGAMLEAKVNQVMSPIYNFCIASGDWYLDEPGEHTVYLKMDVSPEIREYVATHTKRGEAKRESLLGKVPFSGTRNSDWRAYKNMVSDIRAAYQLACWAEYELNGHDTGKMKWPARLQKFMDKFCDGRVGWTPGEANTGVSDVQSPYPEKTDEPTKLSGVNAGVDTTGWDSWKRYSVEKKVRH